MQRLRFFSKHAPPIIEYIFAHEICKLFTFYAYLNALLWNLPFKKSYAAGMRILQRTWMSCVRSKNRVLYEHAQMSGLK